MDTPFGPTFEDDIKQVLAEVPAPIRAFFASGKVQIAAKNLMQKNQLHIDQGTIVERELILLLLGINTPSEFTKALVEEARLDQQTVNRIVQDVNAQIFVPLREEMRKGPSAEIKPPQAQSAAVSAPRPPEVRQQTNVGGPPRPAVLQPRTTIIPANPNLPRTVQTLASVPRYVPPKKYFNLQNKIPPPVQPPPPNFPTPDPRPPASRLLEDHEEPHIEFHPAPLGTSQGVARAPSSTADTPLRQALRAVVPPENLPGVIQPPVKPKPPIAPPPPAKPYSSDPYREPIEP